ncbi:nucleolar pre-ribosomal-associated protein 1-like isoform X1 [Manis javanica]|uniref:nucleolar pre-ribosomal-associated protein 1-like isoform X1 n=1 Tax=Manis javanica TaxID=9974 RepID=UPI003C6D3EB0
MVSKEIPVPPGCRSHFGPLSTCPGAARFLVCVLGVHVPSLLLRKLPVMGGAFVSLGGWCSLATPVLGCRTRKHFAQGVTLAPHRPALPSAQLASFFGALDSVLKYRATITQAFRDMDRFTVNETVLSTKDVLILLHKWSLIGRDTALQEDLRAAIEKYQVKELLKMLKDKNRPVVAARARGPWGRRRRPGEAEEAADPELQVSSLETCKGLLRSILTHWGPVFPSCEPAQEPSDRATPESSALGPVHAAASLVATWVLCSATVDPLSTQQGRCCQTPWMA